MLPEFFRNKKVLLNAVQLYLNKALNALIPFLLIPFYNKIFGVEQYGVLIFIQAIATLLIYITDYGFIVTGTREVSANADNKDHLSTLVSSVILVKVFLTAIVFIILLIVAWLNGMNANMTLLYSLSFLALSLQNFMPSWFFQGMKRNAIITLSNLFSKAILLILVLTVVNKGSELWIVPMVDSLSYFFFFIIGFVLIYSSFKLKFVLPSRDSLLANFKLSKDNFIITLLSWVTTGGVLILTEQFVSDQPFGYYGIFTRICYYAFAAAHQINLAAFPYVAERFARSEKEGLDLLKSISKLYFPVVVCLLMGGLFLGRIFFELFFDQAFLENLDPYLPAFYLLIVWVCLVLCNNFLGLLYFVAKREDGIYRNFYAVNVILSVAGCVFLAPVFGVVGSAASVVAGESILFILLLLKYLREKKLNGG